MRFQIYLLLFLFVFAACGKTEKEKAFLETIGKDEPIQEAFRVKFLF
jgi:hypothetical protein